MTSEHRDDVTICPCCGNVSEAPPAFVHPSVPILLNVLAATEQQARNPPSGRLELCECLHCGLVFNRAFTGVPYGTDYFLDATRSSRYRQHLDDVCDRLARAAEGSPFSIVDVGAGQGTFLTHLVKRLGKQISRAHGFDPAFRSTQADLPANIGFTASSLDTRSAATVDFPVDVVITRHVLEHLPDPVAFLASLREYWPGATLVVETPNVAHTIEQGLLHDFCYEHCSMSRATTLVEALRRAGYAQARVETAFATEYLIAFASVAGTPQSETDALPPAKRPESPSQLAAMAGRFIPEHRARLQQARRPIAIWGGAGKGALFAHLVDPDRALVDLIIDIHPGKQGFFLPGAGHRVVSPEEARHAGVRTVVVANPTYVDEVEALCNANGLRADLECVGNSRQARQTLGRS